MNELVTVLALLTAILNEISLLYVLARRGRL
jgi:hypothetical protein